MAASARELKLIISASTEKMREEMAKAQTALHTTENAMRKMANAFDGSKIKAESNAAVDRVRELGGVTRLTASEQQKLNGILSAAIEKYRALGQTAPQEVLEMEAATRQAAQSTEGFATRITGLVATAAAAKQAVAGVVNIVGDWIASSNAQEEALARLGTALRAQGTYTPALAAQYDQLATQFQKTTRYSDELVMEMQALLVQVGDVMPEDMEAALQASADLAAGLNIDLTSATEKVAKALAGNTTALKKLVPEMELTGNKTKDMGIILDAISGKFGGQATAAVNTFGGQMDRLSNDVDNAKEALGDLIKSVLTPVLQLFTAIPEPIRTAIVVFGLLAGAAATLAVAIGGITAAVKIALPLLSTALPGAIATSEAAALTATGVFGRFWAAAAGPIGIGVAVATTVVGIGMAIEQWAAKAARSAATLEEARAKLQKAQEDRAAVDALDPKQAAGRRLAGDFKDVQYYDQLIAALTQRFNELRQEALKNGPAADRLKASMAELSEEIQELNRAALVPLTDEQKRLAVAGVEAGKSAKYLAEKFEVSEQAVQKYLDSLKKSAPVHKQQQADALKAAEAERRLAEAFQAQVDVLTGKALAQEVAKLAVQVKAAGQQGGITAFQMDLLGKQLVDLRDQGATLPPELAAIVRQFELMHLKGLNVVSTAQSITNVFKGMPKYDMGTPPPSIGQRLNEAGFQTLEQQKATAKKLEALYRDAMVKGVASPETLARLKKAADEAADAVGVSFGKRLGRFLSTDFPKLVSDGIQAGNSTFKSAGVAIAGFLVSDDGFGAYLSKEMQAALGTAITSLSQGASFKQALQKAAPEIGGAIGGAIGQSIGASLGGPAGAAIGKAIGTVAGTITGGLLGGSSNDTKKDREAAAKALGFSSLSALYAHLNTLGKEGAALANQALNQIGKKDTAANQAWIKNVEGLIVSAKQKTDDMNASLVTMRERLADLQAKSKPTWQQMRDAAQSLGIDINSLGTAFQQQRLTEQATEIWNAWDTLRTGAGANLADHIQAMSGKLNAFVKESLTFGTEVPGNMRPMLEEMLKQGLLLDENGERMTDLSRFKFGEDVKSEWEIIGDEISKLTKEIAALVEQLGSGVTGAVKKMVGSFKELPGSVNIDVRANYGSKRDAEYGGAMAEGGSGVVTRPTWFLAGEAGPERYTFTPMGQTASSGGGGDQTIVVQLDGEVIVRKVVYGMPRYLKLIGAQ